MHSSRMRIAIAVIAVLAASASAFVLLSCTSFLGASTATSPSASSTHLYQSAQVDDTSSVDDETSIAVRFTDLSSTGWYATEGPSGGYIRYVVDRGLMDGYAADSGQLFKPNESLTYRMMIATLFRYECSLDSSLLETYQLSTDSIGETDAAAELTEGDRAVWRAAVRWAANQGIVDDTSTAKLDTTVSRETLGLTIYRFLVKTYGLDEVAESSVDFSMYSDGGDVDASARSGMEFCTSWGLITTQGDTLNLNPHGTTTRAQMAKLITGVDELLKCVSEGDAITQLNVPDECADLTGNTYGPINAGTSERYNAAAYGIVPTATAADNTARLQNLVDIVSRAGGGTIFIPGGIYEFCCAGTTVEDGSPIDYAIRCYSNVSIIGANRDTTILKMEGTGRTLYDGKYSGYALFGFAGRSADTLSGCTFSNFTIDAADELAAIDAVPSVYTTTGKGFAFEYVRDCTFSDLTIRNTPATGLGIDFLSNVIITRIDCWNCGALWQDESKYEGGAGIGIGTGAWQGEIPIIDESFVVYDCTATDCGHFGIFVEDQIRWHFIDQASYAQGSYLIGNTVRGNRFGGIGVRGSGGTRVTGNTVSSNKFGIYIDFYTRDSIFMGNTLENNQVDLDIAENYSVKNNVFGMEFISTSGLLEGYHATGSALKPAPVVTRRTACMKVGDEDWNVTDTRLVYGTDYTLAYADNVNPGDATITLTGRGAYTGTIQLGFQVLPAEN